MLDHDIAPLLATASQVLVTIAVATWLYLERRSVRARREIDDLRGRVQSLHTEYLSGLAEVKVGLAERITHGELQAVADDIQAVAQTIDKMSVVLDAVHALARGGRGR